MLNKALGVSNNMYWKLGCVSGSLAILMGAFGAHALKRSKEAKMIKTWETAAQYHLVHSVVLLAVPFCKRPQLAGSLIAGGIILFSGSMYTIVLSGNSKFGVITPIGGMAMVFGWVAMAF